MTVRLSFYTPLSLISGGTRYSHDTRSKSDTKDVNKIGKKDMSLAKRVAFGYNHNSVLEHSLIVFDVKASSKFLLELSRHRVGVSMTVKSSRYTLRKSALEYEKTNYEKIDKVLEQLINNINELLKDKDLPLDEIAMLLPQAYLYDLQLTFNLRSLNHFFVLRLSKSAHRTIRDIAFSMFISLPEDYKELLSSNEELLSLIKEAELTNKIQNMESLHTLGVL